MWTELIVKNYKSIGQKGVDLELKPLTILVGPNGTGKSSILQAVAILNANVREEKFSIDGELIQFSAYEEMAHKHELGKWMTIEIHSSGGEGVRLEYKHDSGEQKETVFINKQKQIQLSLEGNRQKGWKMMCEVPGQQPISLQNTSLIKLRSFQLYTEVNASGADISDKFKKAAPILDSFGANLKEKVFLLSSLRGKVPSTGVSSQVPRWVGMEGDGLLPLLALISNTTLYEETWSKIQNWAVQFGLTKLKAGYRGENKLGADFVDPDLKTTINLAFAGQGSRQIMSVITQLFWAQPDSLIMIEEPELSLHPEAQFMLGNLFADAIKQGKQIMVSTHSHFFLLALNQAVESGLKVEDIAVYHVTKDAEGTKVAPVKLSQRGYPLGWPPSYEKVEKNLARNWAKGLAEK